jgi:hypothetical protein
MRPTITRVEFVNHGAKTRMTLSAEPYPAGRGEAEAGWAAEFDRLAALCIGPQAAPARVSPIRAAPDIS